GKLKGELEDAAFPYAYPKEYAQIEEIIKEEKPLYEKRLAEILHELEKELIKNKVNVVEINYRMKHKYSLWRKLLKRDMDLSKIYDMLALRVVVSNVEECYRVLGVIHSIWRPVPGRIKDYVAIPKPNGYRSIHTTIFTGEGGIAEIQIRTQEMHAEAAYGIAAHFTYKENKYNKRHSDEKSNFKWIEELKKFNHEFSEPQFYLEHLKTDFFNDRIFVFTPEGDVVDLPEDSTAIDFAYLIHSDLGDHLSQVKVNGKIAPIFGILKNRDVVEIISKKNANPSSKWLDNTKSSIAKKHIKSYLEKNSLLARLKSFRKS
ncbi:MAG: TGS domain-containing protein, partial [Patescibacteria group bacterium]